MNLALNLFLYCVDENDGEGDPVDHGVIAALDREQVAPLLAEHFGLLGFEDDMIVRVYPLLTPAGVCVLESDGEYFKVAVTPKAPAGV